MSRLVTSSQCASQPNKRGLCPVFKAVLAAAERERERNSAQRLMYLFGFQLILPLYSHIQMFQYEHFDLFCRLCIFITAWNESPPSVHAGYPVIWLPTPNLWRYLKCIVFTKMPVPSLYLVSPLFSLSFPLFTVSISLSLPQTTLSFSLAYISICPLAGLGEKGLHEQALCHSGRVHQCAECTGWSGLLWREDKEVSRKPAPRHRARSACPSVFSAMPGCPASCCQPNWV